MNKTRHFKPGTDKPLSARTGNFSIRWANLVFKNTGVAKNKKTMAQLESLWRFGYSHKDAGSILVDRLAGMD